MNPAQFIAKWRDADLSERSAAQQHFLDLCELLDHPKPAEADSTGEDFAFEKLTDKHDGERGFADVYKRGHFAWEYKRKGRDLDKAYRQLLEYREALENPPLLVVCDMERFVVHTNFTATPTEVHQIELSELADPRSLEILRAVFHDPERLKPGRTSQAITAEAAERIAEIAQGMRGRGLDPHRVAHFLDRIVFCLFAEDIDLLPERIFTRLLDRAGDEPDRFRRNAERLFDAMADGGELWLEHIPHFNGSLFGHGPVLRMTADEIGRVRQAARLDWGAVDPSIFGTLFERGMDPGKRAQIGAHYTGRQDIETLVEPVVMRPLRREWEEARRVAENLLETGRKSGEEREKPMTKAVRTRSRNEAERLVRRFHERLTQVRVLDPACGSGNFLYVTLQELKDLEKEVVLFAEANGLGQIMVMVGPWQLFGIEVSPYAHDLAQMVVWIGYLQWVKANGFGIRTEPILKPMEGNFQNKDAILDLCDPENPTEPEWPKVDYIVGNPPFLGNPLMRSELGDEYVEALYEVLSDRVPSASDLCCYWFEKARALIEQANCKRAGLLATQSVRGGANRTVLQRIKKTGQIFWAQSDKPWVLDGASVHVSMIAFDDGYEENCILDGVPVKAIHSNLTASVDTTKARFLERYGNLAFMGPSAKAPFDIEEPTALSMLRAPTPSGRPNSDVLRLVNSAIDITQRSRHRWTIDFGRMDLESAALYEAPFEYVEANVRAKRQNPRHTNPAWWQYERPRDDMRIALAKIPRFAVTPGVSKYRLFVWRDRATLCNQGTLVFARSDDYFFGVLHSRLHEVWSRAQGTQLREAESGFRYTPTTCFETFPFPWPPGREPEGDPLVEAVAEAARALNELRENWLNPDQYTVTEVLEFPGSLDGPWARYVHEPDERGVGTVRYPRTVADPPFEDALKQRTLTNLYNEMPAWLRNAHRRLDEAVCAAYAAATGAEWAPGMEEERVLEKLLELNLRRAERTADAD